MMSDFKTTMVTVSSDAAVKVSRVARGVEEIGKVIARDVSIK